MPPMSRPAKGTKNSSPMSVPQSAPLAAPAPVAPDGVSLWSLPSASRVMMLAPASCTTRPRWSSPSLAIAASAVDLS